MRSWLFVPAHEARKASKALTSAADVAILDWEDAVPESQKQQARSTTAELLATADPSVRVVVRINHPSTRWFADDLQALHGLPAAAVMLPKIERADEVQAAAAAGLPLIAMIETAAGLEQISAIAASHALLERLALGSLDFLADIGGRWTPGGEALLYPRARIVVASRAAGLQGPLDGVFPQLRDLDGLRQEATLARTLGFAGKTLIHPEQIAVTHEAFAPTEEELQRARDVIVAYELALAEQRAATTAGAQFIDPPVVRWAEQILRLAGEER